MIACFLNNISAKYHKNPSMLSRVIAKNFGDVFFGDTVYMFIFMFVFYAMFVCFRVLYLLLYDVTVNIIVYI